MKRAFFLVPLAFLLLGTLPFEEPVDLGMITRIKKEGFDSSKIMETAFYLTDVFGSRLTGSSNLKKASLWAKERLTEWGLKNAKLEPWGLFGQGWQVDRCVVEMTEPDYASLIAYPKAWSPGTNGVLEGYPVVVEIADESDFELYHGKLAGAIVLLGTVEEVKTHFEPDATRLTDEELQTKAWAPNPAPSKELLQKKQERASSRATRQKIGAFLEAEGVAAAITASSIEHGTLRIHSSGSYAIGGSAGVPSVVVAKEQYNRMVRLIEKGIAVKIRLDVQTTFDTDDIMAHNVIAEIPGTDGKLKNEVVMLGAHLDSWHAGTGATDNASGCAVMMEAVRILAALDVKPRRTIRIALWSGEEQGLFGSRGYVQEHFADPLTMKLKPEHGKLSGYFNLDNGTGKIRGIYLQENDAVRPVFEAMLEPFNDFGAATVSIRRATSTDHIAFDEVGLPGFQFIQDPIDYGARTWHTNMDVYDHLQENDLMRNAVILASLVYHTAMRAEKLPRKPLPGPVVKE